MTGKNFSFRMSVVFLFVLICTTAYVGAEPKKTDASSETHTLDGSMPWHVPAPVWMKNFSGPLPVENSEAKNDSEMKPYTEKISGTSVTFGMVPIKGGVFLMGSSEKEQEKYGVEADELITVDNASEGPQHKVKVSSFWMGKCEVTWEEYNAWATNTERDLRIASGEKETSEWDKIADAITRPTLAYTDMSFDMGKDSRPAIAMSLYAAQMYCKWLTAKTGRYYRLPTEAEWEYACRAGTTTPYSFNDDDIDDYAWYYDNSDDKYHKVGQKKANPWGLHDMHGNVREWCLDSYSVTCYKERAALMATDEAVITDPLHAFTPGKRYPGVTRGGSWNDDKEYLRSAFKVGSNIGWNADDPQEPKSIWFESSEKWLGFRVVRPLETPSVESAKKYEPDPQVVVDYMKMNKRQQSK